MSNIFIKPASIEIEGVATIALVRDPDTRAPLAIDGEWKSRSSFWNRRVRDGDVLIVEPNAVAPLPVASIFSTCESCAVPAACASAARCVKAPI